MAASFAGWTVTEGDPLAGTLSLVANDHRLVQPTMDLEILERKKLPEGGEIPEEQRRAAERSHRYARVRFMVNFRDGNDSPTYPPGNTLRWVQVVTSTCPLPDTPPTKIDFTEDDLLPFYYTNDEITNNDEGPIRDIANGEDSADDFRFSDFPFRPIWWREDGGSDLNAEGPGKDWKSAHCEWEAVVWLVTWDGEEPGSITLHDGIRWGFKAWPLHDGASPADETTPAGEDATPVPMFYEPESETLLIEPWPMTQVVYSDGTIGDRDAILNSTVVVSPVTLLPPDPIVPYNPLLEVPPQGDTGHRPIEGPTGRMFPFSSASLEIKANGERVVLEARLVDVILNIGSDIPGADSTIQGRLVGVVIDNFIDSRYLSEIRKLFRAGASDYLLSIDSNLLSQTNSLESRGIGSGPPKMFGAQPVIPMLPFGACCLPDSTCIEVPTGFDCERAGGVYQGDGTRCAFVRCDKQPPVAVARLHRIWSRPRFVTFDGRASSDPNSTPGTRNDDIVLYEWLDMLPDGTLVRLGEGDLFRITLSGRRVHHILLRVTDKCGLIDTDELWIDVNALLSG